MDHVLSELSTMTRLSWVALHGMAHSFIELDKAVVLSTSCGIVCSAFKNYELLDSMMVYSAGITLSPPDFAFISLARMYPRVYRRGAAGKWGL